MAPDTTKVMPLTCHGHSRPVTHISFSAITNDDQYYLLSACKDNNPMLRDGITGDWIGTFLGHKGAVWQARLSSDSSLAVTGSADFSAKIWDTHTGEALYTLQHNHIVRAVAFPTSPSPSMLATGGAEKKLRVWDLNRSGNGVSNGTTSPPPSSSSPAASNPTSYEIGPNVHTATIKSVIWSPTDTNILITAADDKKIRWWDLRTSRAPVAEYTVDGPIGSCEMNTSSSRTLTTPVADASILSVAAGKNVYFFDGTSRPGTLLKSHKLPQQADAVAVNLASDGNGGRGKFVTGGATDTWVHVYDYETGEEVEVGKGHHGPVWSVGFAPDGKLYATGSEDGTVKLWKNCAGEFGLWK